MTEREFIDFLRRESEIIGSQRQLAKAIGVSAPYLSDVLRGNRSAGDKILKAYGMVRKVEITVNIEEVKNG